MPSKRDLILGTRGSPLALWQAGFVKKHLEAEYGDLQVTIQPIKTTGDKISETSLSKVGGKGLFLKEIEEHLLNGSIDMGVHSMKDVPVDLPSGLLIGPILKREDPRDVLISKKYSSLFHLPKKAVVGTGSLRRQAQLKHLRPDLEIVPLRGNIDTRLQKLLQPADDELSVPRTILLAACGLTRLGLSSEITEYLPSRTMLSAVGQGAIGIEVREDDERVRGLVDFMNHRETALSLEAERSFLKTLGGDCQSPVAALAEVEGTFLRITGMVASPDGSQLFRDRLEGPVGEALALGAELAEKLLNRGAKEILKNCKNAREKK